MQWHRKGLTATPGKERRLTKEKIAWVRESLCQKWWVMVRTGVNTDPNHLTTLEEWKRGPSSSMGAVEKGVHCLVVCQWMSSVSGTEKDTPMSWPLAAIVENSLCSWRMLPLWEGEATVSEKLFTYKIMRP